jgi:hypothetical protein
MTFLVAWTTTLAVGVGFWTTIIVAVARLIKSVLVSGALTESECHLEHLFAAECTHFFGQSSPSRGSSVLDCLFFKLAARANRSSAD